jgi:single-strand DNA-binding protein
MALNRWQGIGNLGRDPEVRTTPSGVQVATFTVACSDRWTDQDGQSHEKTEWVNCVAWRKQAEVAQRFLRKGSKVYVEGKLQTRSWDDQNGQKQYRTEIVVDTFQMLDPRPQGQQEPPRQERAPRPRPAAPPATPTYQEPDDDLPF